MSINYDPPDTINDFIKFCLPNQLHYCWIVGPVGSGKTTGLFFRIVSLAARQAPSPIDGIRRTRVCVVRNTLPQLRDTTIASFNMWFKDGEAGTWSATQNKFTLRLRDPVAGDIECEVLFRPLDTSDDVSRVLSLELSHACIDEFVEIPREIVDALSARVGRYPSAKDGGCTNFSVFGSSNPADEDNWWWRYLSSELPPNARHFKQPSGLSDKAENIKNLPVGYYENISQGKTEAWQRKFIHSEWGFSITGEPVAAGFKPELHIASKSLNYNPNLRLIVGVDPGLSGSACVFMQQTLDGRLIVLGELVQRGYGAERLIKERLLPYLRERFPGAKPLIVPDPAAANRSSNDERAIVSTFKERFEVSIESNNRLPLRLNAIDHFTSTLSEGIPALQIDPNECPTLVRALRGGWRWAVDQKKDMLKGAEPEDNAYTHVADAFAYGCRYYHRGLLREDRASMSDRPRFTPPRSFGSAYHFR